MAVVKWPKDLSVLLAEFPPDLGYGIFVRFCKVCFRWNKISIVVQIKPLYTRSTVAESVRAPGKEWKAVMLIGSNFGRLF